MLIINNYAKCILQKYEIKVIRKFIYRKSIENNGLINEQAKV